jgi:hypothetical protein
MFTRTDPYSFTKYTPLFAGSAQVGTLKAEYRVTHYDDLQLAGADAVDQPANRMYLVHCTQRIVVWNQTADDVSPTKDDSHYCNYPAIINALMELQADGADVALVDYSPQTVNTKIESAGTQGNTTGATQSSSTSSTVGSSTAETNSYGTSVSAGAGPEGLTGSVSANFEHSSTYTTEHSHTVGDEASRSMSQEATSSASMSMKDWGAYATVNPLTQTPAWTFGQEFPWDAVSCRKIDPAGQPNPGGQVPLAIPAAMLARLSDGDVLWPPSHLSMFGVNFIMRSVWRVTVPNTVTDTITVDHLINYYSASHELEAGPTVRVFLDPQPAILQSDSGEISAAIDLPLMALDPIGLTERAAVVGFIPKKFTVAPDQGPLKILSTANDLLIVDTSDYAGKAAGAKFAASEGSLAATFSGSDQELQLTVYFKIRDSINDYSFFLKHWKGTAGALSLGLTINGNTNAALTRRVDDLEGEGGDNNLSSIELRNQNFATIDYHDYLQLGLNAIVISISPAPDAAGGQAEYHLRALSIEKM